jgi:hypothetical protein
MLVPARAIAMVAATAGEAAARAAEVLRDGSYQRALPPPTAPPELVSLPLGPLGIVLRVLAWAGVAILLLLAATWIARRVGRRTGDVQAAPDPAAVEVPHLPVEGAEALAAEGRFSEAIHALLLDTLGALSEASRLAPSLTSREIVARIPLAPRAREALAALVHEVEVTWFGGAVPAETDYRRCLERFHAFRESFRWAA